MVGAHLLTGVPADNNDWPLSDYQMSVIDENSVQLIKFLDADSDLLCEMRATTCLSSEQIKYLTELHHGNDRNEKLLDMVQRRSVAQFYQFIECLGKTQRHLVPFFTGDKGSWNSETSSYFHWYSKVY